MIAENMLNYYAYALLYFTFLFAIICVDFSLNNIIL